MYVCVWVHAPIAQVVRTIYGVADFSHSTMRVLKMALKIVGLGRKCLHPESYFGPRGFKGPNTLAILLSHSSSWCTAPVRTRTLIAPSQAHCTACDLCPYHQTHSRAWSGFWVSLIKTGKEPELQSLLGLLFKARLFVLRIKWEHVQSA